MKHTLSTWWTAAAWLTVTLTSCNEESVPTADTLKHICITAQDFRTEDTHTRTDFTITSSGAEFAWGVKDTIGIFPDTGAQAYFPMISGAGTKTASFTGGGWALKNGSTYAAYFPFIGSFYLDMSQLPLSYTGQKQTADGSTKHLGYYDYMAASPDAPHNGYVNFLFDHLGCLVQIKATLPDAGEYTLLMLQAEQAIFAREAALDLTGNSYRATATAYTDLTELALEGISTTRSNQTLTLYLMLYPADMRGQEVQVVMKSREGRYYQGSLTSKRLEAGYAYSFSTTLEPTDWAATTPAPGFTDSNL